MPSTTLMKLKLKEDSEDEGTRVPPTMDESIVKKRKNRRPDPKERLSSFEDKIHLEPGAESKPPKNAMNPSLTTASPLTHPELPSSPSKVSAHQTSHSDRATEESDMLTDLDRAVKKMIQNVKEERRDSQGELEAVKGELKSVEDELKIVKEELRLAQLHGEGLEQSRDKALEQLTETKKLLHLANILSTIYKIEYKTASNELVEAEIRLRATRGENNRLFQNKQKAEQLYRSQTNHVKEAEDMAEWLRGELASERARVVELESKYGV